MGDEVVEVEDVIEGGVEVEWKWRWRWWKLRWMR